MVRGSKPLVFESEFERRLYYVRKVEQEGRLALKPCDRCFKRGMSCYVGARSNRCSGCIQAKRTVEACGVDRLKYRTVENFSNSSQQAGTTPHSSADVEPEPMDMTDAAPSATASDPQTQSPRVAFSDKIDQLNHDTTRGFEKTARQMDETEGVVSELLDITTNMEDRVRQLEDVISGLKKLHPQFFAP